MYLPSSQGIRPQHCIARTLSFSLQSDVMVATMASQITSLAIVYSTVYSGADQRKLQSSASLAFVRGIHWWPQRASNAENVSIWWRHPVVTVSRPSCLYEGNTLTKKDGLLMWAAQNLRVHEGSRSCLYIYIWMSHKETYSSTGLWNILIDETLSPVGYVRMRKTGLWTWTLFA